MLVSHEYEVPASDLIIQLQPGIHAEMAGDRYFLYTRGRKYSVTRHFLERFAERQEGLHEDDDDLTILQGWLDMFGRLPLDTARLDRLQSLRGVQKFKVVHQKWIVVVSLRFLTAGPLITLITCYPG